MLPGLQMDSATLKRPAQTVDGEGNATGTLSTVGTIQGTWGTPSSREADAFDELIEGVYATEYTDVRQGDWLTVRSANWTVAHVRPLRTHYRCFLRRR